MTKLEQIDQRIAELEAQLKDPPQQRAEVYTRIVGYYRVVDNWNPGKREEYRHRASFDVSKVSHNAPHQRVMSEKRDNRTTFRPDQKGALPIVAEFAPLELGKADDWDLPERQESAKDFATCESCQ